jgi:DNA-directed RNA polymerase subunit RPC12/RpoP
VKEHEKKAEDHTETVCPECGSRQLVHDYERQNWYARAVGWSLMKISSIADQNGVLSITTSG